MAADDWNVTIPRVNGTTRCDEHRGHLVRLLHSMQAVAEEQTADVHIGVDAV